MKNKHILIMLLATAFLFGATACHKDAQIEPKTPKVTDPDVSYTATTADFGWTVSFPGKVSSVVKVSRHADMSDATSYGDAAPTSNKDFHVEIAGLSPETQYYYCFEIWNPNLNHRTEVKSFTTLTVTKPSVTTSTATNIGWTTATAGGNVTDDGYGVILECGVCWGTSHNPDTGNDFSHLAASSASTGVGGGEVTSDGGDAVTERGIYFGTSPNPVTTGTKLVASSAGTGSFTCTMTGLVEETTYYVCAYASNGQGTSYGSEKNFYYGSVPVGAIKGVFSVGSGKKVYFSQGNLQYRASDGRWKFAEHQYDYIGESNSNISSTYSNYIDLFGWGTSGWNSGAVCYQPWSTSTSLSDYYPGGSYTNNLTGSYANADWGVYNAIYNGGNQAGQWRTLTGGSNGEWKYIFDTRSTSSGIRYAKAQVAGVNGVILLPDDWSTSYYSLSSTNQSDANYSSNTITASQWITLEQHGAVFLPAAGHRYGTSVYDVGSYGNYWSASYSNSSSAYYLIFYSGSLNPSNYESRRLGKSVRLVAPAE